MEPTNNKSASRQIARAAGVVMAGFVLSNLIGLVRTILVSHQFGTSGQLDAFNAAIRLPDTLFMLVAGGALASAFIPTFTGLLENNNRDRSWQLASAILNLISLVLIGASILSAIFAPVIVRTILAPRLPSDLQVLTTTLLRILLISPIIFGASGLLMGILNSHQHFLMPALAPSLHWLGWIAGILLFVPKMGIYGLAWGAVLGAGLHLGVQLPALRRLGWRYQFSLGLNNPDVWETARLMGPRLLGVGVVQLNFWINVILATGMPTGSLSAIDFAWRIMTMPQVVIAQAIAIAALPTFSAQVARGEMDGMRSSLAATLRSVILLSLPATLGLILLGKPVVAMFLQGGEFTADSTVMVTWALIWYTSGLVSHSIVEIVSRSFYALHDTKTPVLVGTAAMGLNIGFSIGFAALFRQVGWAPHGGLALGNTLATTLEMAALLILMRRRLTGMEGNRIISAAIQAAAGSLVMSGGILFWTNHFGDNPSWFVAIGGILLGGVLYGLMMLLLQVKEGKVIIHMLRNRGFRRRV